MSASFLDFLRGDRTPLYLAPQAGVSESPFRRLCREFGADVVVTEFVSAEGIVRGNERPWIPNSHCVRTTRYRAPLAANSRSPASFE